MFRLTTASPVCVRSLYAMRIQITAAAGNQRHKHLGSHIESLMDLSNQLIKTVINGYALFFFNSGYKRFVACPNVLSTLQFLCISTKYSV